MPLPAFLIPLAIALAARPAWEGAKNVDNFADNLSRQISGKEFNPFGLDITPDSPYQPVFTSINSRRGGQKGLIDFGSGPLGLPTINQSRTPIRTDPKAEFAVDVIPAAIGLAAGGLGVAKAAPTLAKLFGSATARGMAGAAMGGIGRGAAGTSSALGRMATLMGTATRGAGGAATRAAISRNLIAKPDINTLLNYFNLASMAAPSGNGAKPSPWITSPNGGLYGYRDYNNPTYGF